MEIKEKEIRNILISGGTGLLPMDLQFFSDEGGDGGGQGDGGDEGGTNNQNTDPGASDEGGNKDDGNGEGNTGNAGADKLFTQEDVNSIAAREAKKAQEKLLKSLGVKDFKTAKEGLAELQKIQDAQKTDAEKLADKAKALEEELQNTTQQNAMLTSKLAALSKDVKPDSVDDVVVLANNLVDDDTDINAAIDKVLEKYPNFKRETETTQQKQDDDKRIKFSSGQHNNNQNDSAKDQWTQAFSWANKG